MVSFTPGEVALCTDGVGAGGAVRRSVREQRHPCSYQESKPNHKVRILVTALTELSRLPFCMFKTKML
jgi:hypothetical protein